MKSTLYLSILVFSMAIFSCIKENNPPIIANQTFEITENSPVGTVVGNIVASDLDGDMLNYEITSAEEIPFSVDLHTGNLVIKEGISLDFENKSQYAFLVKVTDNNKSPLFNFATITVVLKDVVEIPMAGMVAYYPFNNNAIDEGINSYNGLIFGPVGTIDRKGNALSSYSFDGINDYLNLSSLVGNGIRSISLWFRLDMNIDNHLANPVALVTREGDYKNYSEFNLHFVPTIWTGTPGTLRFSYAYNIDESYSVESNNSSWEKDKWYHVVVIIDPSEGMKMYINNVKQNSTRQYYLATAYSELNTYVGSWGTEPNRYFKGCIDDLFFYDRALTKTEVKELYDL